MEKSCVDTSISVFVISQFLVRYFNEMLFSFYFPDMPTQMPPLTPGTNKKLTEVLKASFASWEKEAQNCNTTKGKTFTNSFNIKIVLKTVTNILDSPENRNQNFNPTQPESRPTKFAFFRIYYYHYLNIFSFCKLLSKLPKNWTKKCVRFPNHLLVPQVPVPIRSHKIKVNMLQLPVNFFSPFVLCLALVLVRNYRIRWQQCVTRKQMKNC